MTEFAPLHLCTQDEELSFGFSKPSQLTFELQRLQVPTTDVEPHDTFNWPHGLADTKLHQKSTQSYHQRNLKNQRNGYQRTLDSFARRVFRYDGRVLKYGEPTTLREVQAIEFIEKSGLDIAVPKVYSSGSCREIKYIEMELIKGDTLYKVWDGII